ncbi:Zn-dependent protease [Murinocardiopsis flavida]|uniref:Zn-dependent protease n=1 Tax=Murinocardiopsis flavida TaxID=645275 RepID=A0A2P8DJD8_9ACTN|nr:site-2 protease family protein [Murinocardiopsis flavida]PSK97335.1 Zn-dependent protease [Murinocardiopsis flavida]
MSAPESPGSPARPAGTGDAAKADAAPAADPAGAADTDPRGGRAPSRLDFLPSPVFVLLLGIAGLAGWLSWTRAEAGWTTEGTTAYTPFILVTAAWICCLALQELGRSVLSYRFGDRALRGSAYLRLNPFGYRELFAGLLMPMAFLLVGGFGMVGPALHLDRSAVPGRGARSLVAIGGVVVNLVIAAALLLVVQALVPEGSVTDNWTISGLVFLCYANATAALLALLPVPGLAGYDAIAPYLPARAARLAGSPVGVFAPVALFAVLAFPEVNQAFLATMAGTLDGIGLNQNYVGFGQTLLWPWAG